MDELGFTIYCTDGKMFITKADTIEFVRVKGGVCRYVLKQGDKYFGTLNADYVNAILKN